MPTTRGTGPALPSLKRSRTWKTRSTAWMTRRCVGSSSPCALSYSPSLFPFSPFSRSSLSSHFSAPDSCLPTGSPFYCPVIRSQWRGEYLRIRPEGSGGGGGGGGGGGRGRCAARHKEPATRRQPLICLCTGANRLGNGRGRRRLVAAAAAAARTEKTERPAEHERYCGSVVCCGHMIGVHSGLCVYNTSSALFNIRLQYRLRLT